MDWLHFLKNIGRNISEVIEADQCADTSPACSMWFAIGELTRCNKPVSGEDPTSLREQMQCSGRLIPTTIAAVLLLASSHTHAQQTGDPKAGLTFARQVCAQCHAVDKGTQASADGAAPRFEVIANVRGMTSTALVAALNTSHRKMPNLVLDPGDLDNVIAYILSLKRAD
jgi:mono/diheme cytochrome c family protein